MLITLRKRGKLLAEIIAGRPERKSFLVAWQMNPLCGSFDHVMANKNQQAQILRKAILFAGICMLAGCDGDSSEKPQLPEDVSSHFSYSLETNRLDGLPGAIYRSQASSPLHWQPWTRESLQLARDSNRLILAVIALPQQPSFDTVLKELESDQAVVEQINSSYIPVLVDGDAARELGILTADLCAEIGSGPQLPLMVWFTPDANSVAWLPIPPSEKGVISELFSQSHMMVGRMWTEDPSYVSSNSSTDQKNRRGRMSGRLEEREVSIDPANDAMRALRQLTSLYDPVSRTFDEAGGLFPCGALDLLSLGARLDGVPDDLREKCRMVVGYLLDDLITSAMFDPLDGGAFSSRRGSTWALPGFYRDCATEARIVASLLDSYSVTGDVRALDRALGVLSFIEQEYTTPEGLYCLSSSSGGDTLKWLWTTEDLGEILTPAELSLWKEATGVKSVGNLPSEVDPFRDFLRANSLAFVKFPHQIALARGADPTETAELLDSARRKILKVRDERMEQKSFQLEANAAATFRVVSAYATAYTVTGNGDYLEKAATTLGRAKAHFSKGPELVLYKSNAAASLVAGRAFLYALALQASLDVAATSLDEDWLMWADDLATTAAELFATEGFIKECPPDADLINLPITDQAMLFDESTSGLLGMAATRMALLGRPLLEALAKPVESIPMGAIRSPILHTDIVQAALIRGYGTTYIYGPDIPEASRFSLARMPLKGFTRGTEGRKHVIPLEIKPDGIIRIGPDNRPVPVDELAPPEDPSLHSSPK